jgi:hypothetical protein
MMSQRTHDSRRRYTPPAIRQLGSMSAVTRKSGPGSDGQLQNPKGVGG